METYNDVFLATECGINGKVILWFMYINPQNADGTTQKPSLLRNGVKDFGSLRNRQ